MPVQTLREKIVHAIEWAYNKWLPADDGEDTDWVESADRAMVEQKPIRTRALLHVMALTIVLLFVWAAFAEIDEVTRGEGKVIPSRQIQILQSLDGGVVTEIFIKEGDVVEKGELLVQLDTTRSESTLRENEAEYISLEIKAARLSAIANDTPFQAPEDIMQRAPKLVEQEMALFQSSRDQLTAEMAIASQQLIQREQELIEIMSRYNEAGKAHKLANREWIVTRPLMESGAVSEVELLRLEREVSSLRGERDQALAQLNGVKAAISEAKRKQEEVELGFKNRIREELSTTEARLSTLQQVRSGLSDRVKMTEVRSPVRGTISRLFFNTIGGVVSPGKEVIEVVPLDDSLLLEAKIKPKDIGFLSPSQEAVVKFTAYDFVVYGGLEAVVEHIGADTVMDEEGNPFYTIRVRTKKSQFGDDKPIIPGMVAQVDILTGKKTILAYLLKPVSRAKQYALTER